MLFRRWIWDKENNFDFQKIELNEYQTKALKWKEIKVIKNSTFIFE